MIRNRVLEIGRLVDNPIVTVSKNNTQVTRFTLAVNEKFGETETTNFFKCVAFNKLAKIIEDYLFKGDKVLIVGRLEISKVDYDDGTSDYYTNIIVNEIEFLESKKSEVNNTNSQRTRKSKTR